MTSMDNAIEHAAQAIRRTREFQAGAAFGVPEDAYEDYALGVARALAEAGLLRSIPAHRNGDGESIEEAYQRGHEDGYEKRLKEKP